MVQYSEPFGERIREIQRQHGLSPNLVELLSERRISHMTVRRMARGYPPSSDHIAEFAAAVGRHKGWSESERKALADELLQMVDSRVRYASVKPRHRERPEVGLPVAA